MAWRSVIILVIFTALFPLLCFAGGAHKFAPFEMKGNASDLQIEDDRITFLFSGVITGKRSEPDGRQFELNLTVTGLFVQVTRAVAYQGSLPVGFEFHRQPTEAQTCLSAIPELRLTVPSPTLYFDQLTPTRLEGEIAQFYGCFSGPD